MKQQRIYCAAPSGGNNDDPRSHIPSSQIGTEATLLATPLSEQGVTAVAAPEPDLTGLELKETYRLVRRIGGGGMGVVYQAFQDSLGRSVAVKVLGAGLTTFPMVVERFLREARVLARLSHPNIVQVFDCGTVSSGPLAGHPYIVMEYVESGYTLLDFISRNPTGIPTETAISIAIQTLEALAEAHDHGVIHRDLKPENVLLVERNEGGATRLVAKVCDFGVAKDQSAGPQVTEAGFNPLGTPEYMAPEQVRGESNLDGRLDLYAFGIMFYEMLTGRNPFEGGAHLSPVERMSLHLYHHATPIEQYRADLPQGVVAALLRALKKDPAERPSTARDLIHEIRVGAATADGFSSAPPSPEFPPSEPLPVPLDRPRTPVPSGKASATTAAPPGRKGRKPVRVAIAVMLGSALAIAAVFLLRSSDTDYLPRPHPAVVKPAVPAREREAFPEAIELPPSAPSAAVAVIPPVDPLNADRVQCVTGMQRGRNRVLPAEFAACQKVIRTLGAQPQYDWARNPVDRLIKQFVARQGSVRRRSRAAPAPTPPVTSDPVAAPDDDEEEDEPTPQ